MAAEAWFDAAQRWRVALHELRRIVLACGLEETVKWRQPCYTAGGRNIAILGSRKDHCVLSLFKGALLEDPHGLLEDAGPNTRSARVLRFTDAEGVRSMEDGIRGFITQAVEVARAGRRVERPTAEPEYVEELRRHIAQDAEFGAAFAALTPGRRRGYALHFAQARQASTQAARIARCTPRILAGKGLNDCICGLSKRPPRCDGSHRQLA